jgi:hypothetical protein
LTRILLLRKEKKMRERNVILRGVVLAVVALLIFAGSALADEIIDIEVMITPHHMSLSEGETRFVRCYVRTADLAEIEGESVIYTLGVGWSDDPVFSIQKLQHLDSDDDITAIWFDLPEVRVMLAGKTGDVTLTLNITLEDGTVLSGSDTIIVTE